MKVIVDTNVPVTANGRNTHANPTCVIACTRKLGEIVDNHILVLDDQWQIIGEYQQNLNSTGQPGVGDIFLKWVLTNRKNPNCCELVPITPNKDDGGFAEFPKDATLIGFDLSDRKFVAVALAHLEHPPILNATDSDWGVYQGALKKHGIQVEFLCPDIVS